MSAVRVPGPDGKVILVPVDDGAVGRATSQPWWTRASVIVDPSPVRVSPDRAAAGREKQRERERRYYEAHKAEIMEKQREYRKRLRA